MKIIFLDFDGVLDTASYDWYLTAHNMPETDGWGRPIFDPRCVLNLKRIIEATQADIVVTSSWKYTDSYRDLLQMWEERNMPGFLTDITPNVSNHRGDEIARWLLECKEECNFIIIDDLDPYNFNKDQLEFLIHVDPYIGISDTDVTKAIFLLNS